MSPQGRRTGKVAAGVLAGGKARRWGRKKKGLLEVAPGLSLVGRTLRELYRAGIMEVAILADDPGPYQGLGAEVLADLRPHSGPLGGIETALRYFGDLFEATLFLPCDLPAITAREITILRDGFWNARTGVAVAATLDQEWEPLCAVVGNWLLPSVEQALDEGKRKARVVWKSLGCSLVRFPSPEPFFNLNTPADWELWLARRRDLAREQVPGVVETRFRPQHRTTSVPSGQDRNGSARWIADERSGEVRDGGDYR